MACVGSCLEGMCSNGGCGGVQYSIGSEQPNYNIGNSYNSSVNYGGVM
ncbi:MAG: hypothetical protein OEL87_03255 [Nanoarchaeota archaeon]|nr:hypothetical protein [Nanoarchaeota archaeon]